MERQTSRNFSEMVKERKREKVFSVFLGKNVVFKQSEGSDVTLCYFTRFWTHSALRRVHTGRGKRESYYEKMAWLTPVLRCCSRFLMFAKRLVARVGLLVGWSNGREDVVGLYLLQRSFPHKLFRRKTHRPQSTARQRLYISRSRRYILWLRVIVGPMRKRNENQLTIIHTLIEEPKFSSSAFETLSTNANFSTYSRRTYHTHTH